MAVLEAYDNRMKRYKCWLLASISKEKLEGRIQETDDLVDWMKEMREIEAAEPNKLYHIVAD